MELKDKKDNKNLSSHKVNLKWQIGIKENVHYAVKLVKIVFVLKKEIKLIGIKELVRNVIKYAKIVYAIDLFNLFIYLFKYFYMFK
jgi:hypothetical protein